MAARLPPQTNRQVRTVFSSSGKFVVTGLLPGEGAQIAGWAEACADRLRGVVGVSTEPALNGILEIHCVRTDSTQRDGRVARGQAWVGGELVQKLEFVNPERADQEDLLEGLCWLLFNRMAIQRQSVEERSRQLAEAPDWLTVGIAQNLYPESRSRNMQRMMSLWSTGESPGLAEVCSWVRMPPGRWDDKSCAGATVAWMRGLKPGLGLWESIASQLSRRRPMDASSLAKDQLNFVSIAAAEKDRDLWLMRQRMAGLELGVVSDDRMGQLDELMSIRPENYGYTSGGTVPVAVDLKELLARRREPWAADIAGKLAVRTRMAAVGQAREFQEVCARFSDALEAAAKSRTRSTVSDGALQQMRQAAEQALADLRGKLKSRREFLERVERQPAAAPVPPAIKAFMDKVEQGLERRPSS